MYILYYRCDIQVRGNVAICISDAVTTSHQQFFPFFNDTIYRIYNFSIFS